MKISKYPRYKKSGLCPECKKKVLSNDDNDCFFHCSCGNNFDKEKYLVQIGLSIRKDGEGYMVSKLNPVTEKIEDFKRFGSWEKLQGYLEDI